MYFGLKGERSSGSGNHGGDLRFWGGERGERGGEGRAKMPTGFSPGCYGREMPVPRPRNKVEISWNINDVARSLCSL